MKLEHSGESAEHYEKTKKHGLVFLKMLRHILNSRVPDDHQFVLRLSKIVKRALMESLDLRNLLSTVFRQGCQIPLHNRSRLYMEFDRKFMSCSHFEPVGNVPELCNPDSESD